MAFVPEKAKAVQEAQFDGEWKVCRRSGCDVLVSHPAHPEFRKERQRLEAAERRRLTLVGRQADKPLPEDSAEEVMLRAVANKLLRGWRRVEQADGTPIPFTSEMAYTLLKDIVSFRVDVLDIISAMGDEDADEVEAVSGNS